MLRLSLVPSLVVCFCGCLSSPEPHLPEEMEVVLPAGQKIVAQAGSGPTALADSTWELYRKPDSADSTADVDSPGPYGGVLGTGFIQRPEPDTVMAVARFAEEGRFTRISGNTFYLPAIVGDEIIADGRFHPARVPGLMLAARSFGAADGNRIGVAIPLDVRFFNMRVGNAVAYLWGTLDGDRIDGTFGYRADFAGGLGSLVFGEGGGDQFPSYALRQ